MTPRFVQHHPVYCAVRGAHVLGFYALSGVGARMFDHAVATLRADDAHVLRIASDPYAEGFYLRMRAASRSVAVHAEQEDAAADGAGRWAPETQAYLI